jgi:hypothetical protein
MREVTHHGELRHFWTETAEPNILCAQDIFMDRRRARTSREQILDFEEEPVCLRAFLRYRIAEAIEY